MQKKTLNSRWQSEPRTWARLNQNQRNVHTVFDRVLLIDPMSIDRQQSDGPAIKPLRCHNQYAGSVEQGYKLIPSKPVLRCSFDCAYKRNTVNYNDRHT